MVTDPVPGGQGLPDFYRFGDPRSCGRFEWHQSAFERVVRAVGEVDMSNVAELTLGLEELNDRRLTFDLTEVTFIDSTGLGGLVSLAETIKPRRMSLRIKQGSQVDRLLAISALDGLFSVSRC